MVAGCIDWREGLDFERCWGGLGFLHDGLVEVVEEGLIRSAYM